MASWLATGAGASAGLDKLLARYLAEDKFAEEMRSSRAQEENQRKQLEENSGWRKLQIEQQRDARKDAEQQREFDRIGRVVAMRPIGSQVTEAEMKREMEAGIPSAIYKPGGRPEDAETAGTSNMVPFQTWGGSQTQLHSQERIKNLEDQRDIANDAAYQSRLLREHAERRPMEQGIPPVQVADPNVPGGVRLLPRGQVTPYGPGLGAVPSMTPPGGAPAAPPAAPPAPTGPPISETGGTVNQGPAPRIPTGAQPSGTGPQLPKGTEVGAPGTPGGVPAGPPAGGYSAPAPAANRIKLDAYKTTMKMIEDLERDHPVDTWDPALGWWDKNVGGTLRATVPYADQLPDVLTGGGSKGESLRTKIGRLVAQASFQEGGEQFTGTEQELLQSFLSSVERQPVVASGRLQEFKRQAQLWINALTGGGASPGNPGAVPGRRKFNPATGRIE